MPREVSQKIGKDKRVSAIEKIFIKEKNRVAPNAYNTDEAYRQKVYGVYLGNNKAAKDGLTGEISYLS